MQAHQHAANADDFLARGLLIPAAEEHYKAAEAFQACVDVSNDENVRPCLLVWFPSAHHLSLCDVHSINPAFLGLDQANFAHVT